LKKIILIIFCLVPAVNAGATQIQDVPFFKQERHKCGPSALASVLTFYGIKVDEARIIKDTYSDKLKGSLITDLENYAKGLGFQTKSGQGTIDTIKENILAQKPVIVLIDLGIWKVAKPHYIVVFGFNEDGFIAHNGKKAATLFKYARFEKSWAKFGRPFLIIRP
jgi:ABC-type bacteriocin/lantibiotic exporter with double-glycine peptidase domain